MQRSAALFAIFLITIGTLYISSCRNRDRTEAGSCQTDANCSDRAPFCAPDGVCVECLETVQCECNQQCLDNLCQALGVERPNQSLNAHGNWLGTPGQADYQYEGSCTQNSECSIGEICNPLTQGCVMAAQFVENCNPEDANDCPAGPNGELLVCEPLSQKCMPAPTCRVTHNCCGQENLICDSSAQICRAIADECVPPTDVTTTCPLEPKNQDSCLPSYFCSLVGTCVQCTCDADCNTSGESGLKCHAPSQTCKSLDYCETPADCNQPSESCDRTSNLCKPSCTVETELEDCGTNFFCEPTDKVCISKINLPCTDDGYGPNDSAATAANLELPTRGSSTQISDLSVCNNDDDWFAISMSAGDRLAVSMSSPDPTMSAQLFIISSDGESILASGLLNNLGGSQLLDFSANTESQYFLKIDPTGSSEGWYNLSLTMSQGEICDDPFELNSPNETASTASVLLNESTESFPEGCIYETTQDTSFVRCASNVLKICLGDVDYYKVTLSHPGLLEISIKDFLGELNLIVFGPFAENEAFDSNRIVTTEDSAQTPANTVETVAENASFYYVKVSGGPSGESVYTLETRVNRTQND